MASPTFSIVTAVYNVEPYLADFIASIEAQRFDAVLLDLNLNGVRSYPVADVLAARDVPFAFATGYGVDGLRDADRGRPLLVKPYEITALKTLLVEILPPLIESGQTDR